MNWRDSFFKHPSTLLAIAFFALLGVLIYVGVLAGQRFTDITQTLTEMRTIRYPRAEIERLRALTGEIELSVKAYTLTRDDQFMDDYLANTFVVIDEMEALQADSVRYPDPVNAAIDSLDQLIFKRLDMLGVIMDSVDEFRVAKAMNQVDAAVRRANETPELDQEAPPQEEANSRLGRLFKRRGKADVPLVDADSLHAERIEQIGKDLRYISTDQRRRESDIRNITLQLSTHGRTLNESIDSISYFVSELEVQYQEAQADQVAELAQESRRAVNAGISILVVMISLFMLGIVLLLRSSKRFIKATREASATAMELAETKERFVANVSHELRTPLNAILGYIEMFKERGGNREQTLVQHIDHASQHLKSLINDMLDWSKVNHTDFILDERAMDLPALVEEVKSILSVQLRNDVSLVTEVQLDHPYYIGDPIRLKQVLINIAGNAVKFTEQGSVRIRVSKGGQGSVVIEVIDTGIGIPDEKIAKVFQDFEQVQDEAQLAAQGTGLGLPIAKRIIELMGGDIHVESEVGAGTTMRITLPLAKGKKGAQAGQSFDVPDLSGKHLLIVDDNPLNLDVLEHVLLRTEATVQRAASADKAMELAAKKAPDVAIIDLRMPGRDGYALCADLRSMLGSKVVLIALTASSEDAVATRVEEAGFDVLLGKPIDRPALFKELLAIDGVGALKHSAMEAPTVEPQGGQIDTAHLLGVLAGDKAFMFQLLEEFMEMIQQESKGLKQAVEARDHARIDALVHRLMPSTKQVGCESLIDAMKNLRKSAENGASTAQLKQDYSNFEQAMQGVVAELRELLANTA